MIVPDELIGDRIRLAKHSEFCSAQAYEAVVESWTELEPFQPWLPKTTSVESCVQYSRWVAPQWGTRFDYQIFTLDTNRFVGQANLEDFRPDIPSIMVGYWVRTSETGKGYATEAARLLMECAFTALKVNRFELRCDARNAKSQRVAEKLGLELEGRLRNDQRDTYGGLADTLVYSRLS